MLTKEQIQEFVDLAKSTPEKQNQHYIAKALCLAPELARQLLELMDLMEKKNSAIWHCLRLIDEEIEGFNLNFGEIWEIIDRNIGLGKLPIIDLLVMQSRKDEQKTFLEDLRKCLATICG
jgi:hypothetical protein